MIIIILIFIIYNNIIDYYQYDFNDYYSININDDYSYYLLSY